MGRDVAGARHAGRLKGGEQVHKTCIRVLPVQRARRKGQGEDGKLGYHTLGAKTRVPASSAYGNSIVGMAFEKENVRPRSRTSQNNFQPNESEYSLPLPVKTRPWIQQLAGRRAPQSEQ